MTDPAQVLATSPITVVPTPSCIRRERSARDQAVTVPPREVDPRDAGARRPAVRELLAGALAGVRLSCRDSQFLSRLVHWDKRNAASVASLLVRAREAGREEAGLTPRQREVVLAALRDATVYRASGTASMGCWDCEIIPGGRCAEHARDNDRARAYAELAAALSGSAALSGQGAAGVPGGGVLPGAGVLAEASPAELARLTEMAGYRRRTPVAS